MRYAVIFLLLSVGWIVLAIHWGGWGWVALWPGVSFGIVGTGYAGLGPGVFGKRADGRLPVVRLLLLFPYVLLAWISWAIVRLLTSEPACSEVGRGLWISRRPVARELPSGIERIVDTTCELWEPRSVRRSAGYRCEPTLDERFFPPERAASLVSDIGQFNGPVLIHCAQGHGRSAALAAAVLVFRGVATDLDDAARQIKAVRPRVRIHPDQKRAANRALDLLGSRPVARVVDPTG